LVENALKLERNFLLEASRSMQPEQKVLIEFFQHFSKQIQDIQNFREKNRKSQLFNHLSAISESIGALGWLAIQPAPTPYIKEMSDSAQFYTNRVLKDYKDKDVNHSNWVKLWLQLLSNLQAYVKEYHTTGVSWNTTRKSGKFELSRLTSSSSQKEAGTSSGPAPPPPPPIPNFNELLVDDNKSTPQPVVSNSEALFAELNKGSDITKTLKKVSDDQKTHKNPNLRAGNTVPSDSSATSSMKSTKSNVSKDKKSPVFKLVEKKWLIEYQEGKHDLTIEDTELKQTVYIYKCSECTITVKGKVNSISVDSCSRVGIIFDDVLSTVEFVNCQNVQTQVLGKVPTVSIEKTDGCQVFLSRQSVESEVVSSKSSAMNILIPNEHDDEYTEHPIPEQFKTVFNKGSKKLITSATECV
jgi:adenylyl cyclase-associated protein